MAAFCRRISVFFACPLLLAASSAPASAVATVERSDIVAGTLAWMDAVVNKSSPRKVADLFCEDGLLVATAGVGIRMRNASEDGWGAAKPAGTTIKSYFDWFAALPEQAILGYHHNIENVTKDVWVNNAFVNWTWEGNPGLVARMTFVFRASSSGLCIFELHSSQLPESPDRRRLRGAGDALDSAAARSTNEERRFEVASVTAAWMHAVVNKSSPTGVSSLFCDDGILVATAGVGILTPTAGTDGWGNEKPDGSTIKSYFKWFATLPEQDISKSHNNIVKVTDDVWINNAWVNWVWTGTPGLTARMTFIFRAAPMGSCIFELHSSQLPAN